MQLKTGLVAILFFGSCGLLDHYSTKSVNYASFIGYSYVPASRKDVFDRALSSVRIKKTQHQF